MEELGIRQKYELSVDSKGAIFLLSERDKGKDSFYYWFI